MTTTPKTAHPYRELPDLRQRMCQAVQDADHGALVAICTRLIELKVFFGMPAPFGPQKPKLQERSSFEGICQICGGWFGVGEPIWWGAKGNSSHQACGPYTQEAATAAGRRKFPVSVPTVVPIVDPPAVGPKGQPQAPAPAVASLPPTHNTVDVETPDPSSRDDIIAMVPGGQGAALESTGRKQAPRAPIEQFLIAAQVDVTVLPGKFELERILRLPTTVAFMTEQRVRPSSIRNTFYAYRQRVRVAAQPQGTTVPRVQRAARHEPLVPTPTTRTWWQRFWQRGN